MQFLKNPVVVAWKDFFANLFTRWLEHDNPTAAAAIAFYVLFALTPIVVFAVTIGGMVLGNEGAKESAQEFLGDYLGREEAAEMLQTIKVQALSTQAILPTLLSAVIMMWSSSAIFIQFQTALNQINGYESAATFKGSLIAVAVGRLRAMVFALGSGLMLAVGALASAWSHADWMRLPIEGIVPHTLQQWFVFQVASWAVVWIVFTMILRYLPLKRPRWREAITGGTASTILFQVGKYLIAIAIQHSSAASAYGPASVIVVTVLWVFLSAQLILLSAELGHLLYAPDISPLPAYRRRRKSAEAEWPPRETETTHPDRI